jgi:DNA-binding MarR family transcriptional regulator
LTNQEYRALSDFRYQIRRFLHFSEEAARQDGLEPQQHQMLLAIRGLAVDQNPTISQVAEHLVLRHHSAVGLADRLEKRGLLERVRSDDDRRQVRLRLTPDGAERIRRLSKLHREELRHSGPGLIDALRCAIELAASGGEA